MNNPMASNSERDSDCGGTGPDVGCDGVCFSGLVDDCAGECNGSAVEDCSGECNGSAVVDCAGICGGAMAQVSQKAHVIVMVHCLKKTLIALVTA